MSPRRKSYAVAEAVTASDPDLDPIVVRFDMDERALAVGTTVMEAVLREAARRMA